jgi:SAM-dependent methyltransferase
MNLHGYSTRVRNRAVAAAVRSLLSSVPPSRSCPPSLLDVGCGAVGIAPYLPECRVLGVDLVAPDDLDAGRPSFRFQRGNITSLPFPDRSFSVVTCIDVVEHLPVELRERAIREVVRVAEHAFVIACPFGPNARRTDEQFRADCERRGATLPSWLVDHLRQPHPDEDLLRRHIAAAVRASGREARLDVSYCDPIAVHRLVRAASRHRVLYGLASLALGAAIPVLPRPDARSSYRIVISGGFVRP